MLLGVVSRRDRAGANGGSVAEYPRPKNKEAAQAIERILRNIVANSQVATGKVMGDDGTGSAAVHGGTDTAGCYIPGNSSHADTIHHQGGDVDLQLS